MLIASKHKRPKAPVTLDSKVYFFTPIDPADPDSEHVADVQDTAHIQKFLCVPEGYHIAEAQGLPAIPSRPVAAPVATTATVATTPTVPAPGSSTSTPSGAGVPVVTDPTNTGDGTDTGAGQPTPEQTEAAQALISMSWQKLKTVAEGTAAPVLALAQSIEKAKPEIEQRETVLKVLAKALEG